MGMKLTDTKITKISHKFTRKTENFEEQKFLVTFVKFLWFCICKIHTPYRVPPKETQ
jgi:hypothetical protein